MKLQLDEEVDGAVRKALEKHNPNGFEEDLYAKIYVEIITILNNKDNIENRYGYAFKVAKNIIMAELINKVIAIINE